MGKSGWENLKQKIQNIDGWISEIETKFLYDTAKKLRTGGVIVEIGSWKGRSTICLALGSKEGGEAKVYAIDPHTGSPDLVAPGEKVWTYDQFIKNDREAGVADLIIPVVSTAEEAIKKWDLPISMIFIDAHYHDYQLTQNLLIEWAPHVIERGVIALNNVAPSFYGILRNKPLHGLPGPRKAASNFIFKSKNFKNVGLAGCIVYAEKCEQNNLLDRWKNWFMEQKINSLYGIHWLYLKSTNLPQPIKTFLKRITGF